jgi:hypothetical protein
MQTRSTLTALCAAALMMLSACDRSDPEIPYVAPAKVDSVPAPVSDASVPPAAAVVTPAPVIPQAASAARTNDALTRAQESTSMPVAGQNNDHSAPLAADSGASAAK